MFAHQIDISKTLLSIEHSQILNSAATTSYLEI
jgi:hypothetical protein